MSAIVAIALALPAAASADEASVDMFSTAFNPAQLTVVAGDTVTWRNGDIVVHDVKGAAFTSGIIGRFESFSQRFDTPGTQAYVCTLHLGMAAQLEVLAAQLTAPTGAAYAGETIELKGRTASGAAVTLERDAGGGAWQPAGTVTAASNGTFKASVEAAAGYRARTAGGESPAVAATVLPVPNVKLKAAKGPPAGDDDAGRQGPRRALRAAQGERLARLRHQEARRGGARLRGRARRQAARRADARQDRARHEQDAPALSGGRAHCPPAGDAQALEAAL